MDKKVYNFCKDQIQKHPVSVMYDPINDSKEYSVILDDDRMLVLMFYTTVIMGNIRFIHYIIAIEDTTLTEVLIPSNKKIYSANEQDILDLFKLCSNKIIFQEMNNNFYDILKKKSQQNIRLN